MKTVKILKRLLIAGKPAREGDTATVSDSVAKDLISRGVAINVVAPVTDKDPEQAEPVAVQEDEPASKRGKRK